eukprot:Transcript_26677.p1 GENE.Transcript_26677~~Transcript_26677.p1  ORF type:complete len:457 (-),score=158.88 Transcript_26677:22-1392(-)
MIAGAVLAYKPPHSHSLTPDLLDGGPLPAQPRSRAHTVEDAEPSVSPPPPCASLSCTNRLTALEPSWVNLSFQPRIDWQAGGLRGDCVVGEYEYIMHAYCDPPGAHTPAALGQRPSLERLVSADVHTQALPKAGFAELAALVGNRTLLIMGDSVMEQFYNALQCMLRREGLERPTDAAFRAFIELNRPLWTMGKRKMPPKLPQQATNGMRMLFSRAVTYQVEDVAAAARTADVLVLNFGLHYHDLDQYRRDLHSAFAQLGERHEAGGGSGGGVQLVLFQETAAQHFPSSDQRGYTTGEWEARDKARSAYCPPALAGLLCLPLSPSPSLCVSPLRPVPQGKPRTPHHSRAPQATDAQCACAPIEDFTVSGKNTALQEVLGTGKYPHVKVLPFYELTRPRWRWHFGNCTHRPNGWKKETCCDCTHWCYSPTMWSAHVHDITSALWQHERSLLGQAKKS